MKNSMLTCALVAAVILALCPTGFAQGSLTPPGPPAPTMKSLDQIEPRTIVNAVNTPGDAGDMFIISQPGSYYLTTNITVTAAQHGITVTTNNVTIDLSGFALQGVPGAYYNGINLQSAITNLTVRNGNISGWGNCGVDSYRSLVSQNLFFEHLNISTCGMGVFTLGACVIRDCTLNDNSNGGLECANEGTPGCIISGCTVCNNDGDGIEVFNGTVSGCTASQNTLGGIQVEIGTVSGCVACENIDTGIFLQSGTMSDSMANDNGQDGIFLNYGTASGCAATDNDGSGIYGWQMVVSDCTADYNGNNGIEVDSPSASYGAGTVSGCVVQNNKNNGIFVNGSGAVITGNNCDNNNTSTNSGCAGITIYYCASNRIENNHVQGTGYAGINVSGSNNIVIKNSVFGNVANDYIISGTQITGPIITATGTISSSSPWANFAF